MVPWRHILPISLLLLSLPSTVFCKRKAFISILSSDDFLLPAKVIAHRLEVINPDIPFVILATEDVSNATIEVLLSRDVNVLQIHKIDTPFLDTHAGAKFQYTKIRLWSLTEYDILLHIDLDTLPLSDLSAVFECGSFCATFRHSDKFNAGVFVLEPNISVYRDLLEKVSNLDSYDGGDQGFFNAYFEELKYAPMFNDKTPNNQKYAANMRRMSAAYNYDIGMYYLNGGHTLLEPKIIHYTLGPTKPWAWWTYPVFDLNLLWNDARIKMETAYHERNSNKYLMLCGIVILATMFVFREFTLFVTRTAIRKDKISTLEYKLLPYMITLVSTLLAFILTPIDAHPGASWCFFASCAVSLNFFFSDVYITIRLGRSSGFMKMVACMAISLSLIGSSWTFLALMPTFGLRACMTIPIVIANLLFLSYLIRCVILSNALMYQCTKYQMLPVTKDCVQ